MAMPVFVLGLQRSGTTWIANLLAGSGVVAAVTSEDHRGVHESVFFSHFARAFGSFSDATARARFRDAFLASDYFVLSGLPQAVVDEAIMKADDYAGVFSAMMDALAGRDGCTHWLEKSPHHALLAEELAARFPDARFVCVIRPSPALIASRLAAYGRMPPRGPKRAADILRGTLTNALYVRRLTRFSRNCDRALLLNYADLVADRAGGLASLAEFLELDVAPEHLNSQFEANSSHVDNRTRRLTRIDLLLVKAGDMMGRVIPLSMLSAIEQRRRRARGIDWPDWVWLRTGYHLQ